MKNSRILLVDDHQMFRSALRSLLEKSENLTIVGETGDAFEVLSLARKTSADIVCMDIGMPGMNGIETTRQLIAACPLIKVIALSSYSDQKYVQDMMSAGASAYVTKVEAADELLQAILLVQQNRKYLCPDVANVLLDELSPIHDDESCTLSKRERQVLCLVAEGQTSMIIADRLNISSSTVDVHRRNILRKLKMHNVADLTRYAISNNILVR